MKLQDYEIKKLIAGLVLMSVLWELSDDEQAAIKKIIDRMNKELK